MAPELLLAHWLKHMGHHEDGKLLSKLLYLNFKVNLGPSLLAFREKKEEEIHTEEAVDSRKFNQNLKLQMQHSETLIVFNQSPPSNSLKHHIRSLHFHSIRCDYSVACEEGPRYNGASANWGYTAELRRVLLPMSIGPACECTRWASWLVGRIYQKKNFFFLNLIFKENRRGNLRCIQADYRWFVNADQA